MSVVRAGIRRHRSMAGNPRTAPAPRRTVRVAVAGHLGHLSERLSRACGLGAGGVIGGRVMLALAPGAVRELAEGREVVLVSGTNGKTTTSSYLAACLRTRTPVASNDDGANTPAGITHALASGPTPAVVLETDEGWLPWALAETGARTAVLLNLSRDQLHRHHEVAALAVSWERALGALDHAVVNCDDPDVVFSALAARRQTWVSAGIRWTADALVCPRCGDECRRAGQHWGCGCGLRRPCPDWWLDGTELVSHTRRIELRIGLPGRANLANAAMAVAAAAALGVDPEVAARALRDIVTVAGRYDHLDHHGRRARLILAKNPASWVEALAMISQTSTPLVLAFNSGGADGRDPSWLYDVRFSDIDGRQVVVTGRRATDMLVRLEMEGISGVLEAPDAAAALEMLPQGPVDVVANYTAFQDVRRELSHG